MFAAPTTPPTSSGSNDTTTSDTSVTSGIAETATSGQRASATSADDGPNRISADAVSTLGDVTGNASSGDDNDNEAGSRNSTAATTIRPSKRPRGKRREKSMSETIHL
ncbi:PREDICTED: uncharacterized protein LOC106821286 [Priapulus caudatus]|uniref:Uncharacterized protein LOC106821286 n=1 Tax=Priapulus caudatus TaxID=37621 RepID=A0ABM1FAP6_PRICU|nr:PREDICTED: uncharacterized protein LOC106821286 [Priapulus caudatus]